LRGVTGKDGTPLNELELLAESLMNNDGVLRGNNVIRYAAEKTVVGLISDIDMTPIDVGGLDQAAQIPAPIASGARIPDAASRRTAQLGTPTRGLARTRARRRQRKLTA